MPSKPEAGVPARWELLRGQPGPPPALTELTAGPFDGWLEGVDLRYLDAGEEELVRRIYVAVRDERWGTVPGRVTDLRTARNDDGFRVSFEVTHEEGDLAFGWRGEIRGDGERIVYRLDGAARSAFSYRRIGLCVLHPPLAAGARYRARTPDGWLTGRLPELIAPQREQSGVLQPLFPSYRDLWIERTPGQWVRFVFEGDLFEMEDQRNWTDGSFKTYSTPLALGGPHRAEPGQAIRQQVTTELVSR